MPQRFKLQVDFKPSRDQQTTINTLYQNLLDHQNHQTLLGVTGSGKTFIMASLIAKINRPALIVTHNKTLTAQLYNEFKSFFPNNAVEYFVSYYDYFQPEAYVPASDLYIDKEVSVNDELEKLRLSATRSLFERDDVIIVSSVSCLYGLGSPEAYIGVTLKLNVGQAYSRESIVEKLVEMQYKRNDIGFQRATFRLRGDRIDVYPAYEDTGIRIALEDGKVARIERFDPLTGKKTRTFDYHAIYPATHYISRQEQMQATLNLINQELEMRLTELKAQNKLVEAQRLEQRTKLDMEMLKETGTCNGIENYSPILYRTPKGEPPSTLVNYMPQNSLVFVDESHVCLPQIRGMSAGDYSRKQNLVNFGFRLPSAVDNRPLRFNEFEKIIKQCIYVSATPGDYEHQKSTSVVEQLTRPTGLIDPEVIIRPTESQVDDMFGEIEQRVKNKERVLITTLTKRMAENLTDYYQELGVKVAYLHSDIDTLERTEILRKLRLGVFDVIIGINLLREGLDLPEVSLVGIFDADKEGFLRSYRSLLQTFGRAARNVHGQVILYADKMTDSMRKSIEETERRREFQHQYNLEHNITPTTIQKSIQQSWVQKVPNSKSKKQPRTMQQISTHIEKIEKQMHRASKDWQFEKAIELRDELKYWKDVELGIVEQHLPPKKA